MLQATAQLEMKRKKLATHLQKVGVGLGGLGKNLAERTTYLFDQVRIKRQGANALHSCVSMHAGVKATPLVRLSSQAI